MQRQAGLAHPAYPGQRDESGSLKSLGYALPIGLPTNKVRELVRKVGWRAYLLVRCDGVILAQDGRFEVAQLRRRIQTELFGEQIAVVTERLQRFGGASCPVQGDHELAARPIAEGLRGQQRLEQAERLIGAAQR
jgi:hypothetical protein